MIYLCSNCGHHLEVPLGDGLCICSICQNDVSDSLYDRLMSAAWTAYRKNVDCYDRLQAMTKFSEEEVILVSAYMIDGCYSIDEFKVALQHLGIKK